MSSQWHFLTVCYLSCFLIIKLTIQPKCVTHLLHYVVMTTWHLPINGLLPASQLGFSLTQNVNLFKQGLSLGVRFLLHHLRQNMSCDTPTLTTRGCHCHKLLNVYGTSQFSFHIQVISHRFNQYPTNMQMIYHQCTIDILPISNSYITYAQSIV